MGGSRAKLSSALQARLQGVQLRERLLQVVAGDLFFLYVQRVEDRLVEHAPLIVVAPQVQRLRVFQQGERALDEPHGFDEILGGLAKSFCQVLAPSLDVSQP